METRNGLYRGKRKDNGQWVLGYYVCAKINGNSADIIIPLSGYLNLAKTDEMIEIIPETLCQCIGFIDDNCKNIFENDVIHCYGRECYSGAWEISCTIIAKSNCEETLIPLENAEHVEVLGNIFDNPELLDVVDKPKECWTTNECANNDNVPDPF